MEFVMNKGITVTIDDDEIVSWNHDQKKKAYFIQDYEPWFFPMGDQYLITENSYKYGFLPVTIGKWLAHKMEQEFNTPAEYFDFGADLNVYKPLENVEKENAIC